MRFRPKTYFYLFLIDSKRTPKYKKETQTSQINWSLGLFNV